MSTPTEGRCQRCRQVRPLFGWETAPWPWEIDLPDVELELCSPCWSATDEEDDQVQTADARRKWCAWVAEIAARPTDDLRPGDIR